MRSGTFSPVPLNCRCLMYVKNIFKSLIQWGVRRLDIVMLGPYLVTDSRKRNDHTDVCVRVIFPGPLYSNKLPVIRVSRTCSSFSATSCKLSSVSDKFLRPIFVSSEVKRDYLT